MKWISAAAIVAATVMTVVSCNSEEAVNNGDERVAVKFAATNMSSVQTRVSGDQWNGGDAIGIYMVATGTTTVTNSAENIPYTAAANGATVSFTSATPIYYPTAVTPTMGFIAYHPYNAGVTGWVYPVNTAGQTSQSGIDLMYADHSAGAYDKTSSTVTLGFAHKLVKLRMTLSAGGGVSTSGLNGATVTIKGMNTTADFDLQTAALSSEGGAADITPYKNGNVYEAILLPVASTGAGHKVEVVIGSTTYTWTLNLGTPAIGSLDAGKIYDYAITVGQYAVGISGTITDWTLAGGTGAAEPTP